MSPDDFSKRWFDTTVVDSLSKLVDMDQSSISVKKFLQIMLSNRFRIATIVPSVHPTCREEIGVSVLGSLRWMLMLTDRFIQRRSCFASCLIHCGNDRSAVHIEPADIGIEIVQSNEIPIVETCKRERTFGCSGTSAQTEIDRLPSSRDAKS